MIENKYKKLPEEYDLTDMVGQSLLDKQMNKNMKNGMFKLDWANIKSAVVYGLLTLGVTFLLSVVETILKAGSVFHINWHQVVDGGAMAVLPVFITMISLLKNLLTTNSGKFLGIVKVVPPVE